MVRDTLQQYAEENSGWAVESAGWDVGDTDVIYGSGTTVHAVDWYRGSDTPVAAVSATFNAEITALLAEKYARQYPVGIEEDPLEANRGNPWVAVCDDDVTRCFTLRDDEAAGLADVFDEALDGLDRLRL